MAGERILASLSDRLLTLDRVIEANEKKRVSAEDTLAFIESKKNAATLKKTKSDVKRFRGWLLEESETREIETIPPRELDMLIARFLMTIKNNRTLGELEPSTLKGMVASIRRHLMDLNYPEDPTNSKEFKHSRDMLKAKAVHLKQLGKGNKSMRADPFTSDEIKTLYRQGLLGAGKIVDCLSVICLHVA